MDLQEAADKLGINRTRLYRVRKRIGILAETKREVSETNFKIIENKLKSRADYEAPNARIASAPDAVRVIEIHPADRDDVRILKESINDNLKIIAYQRKLLDDAEAGEGLPAKAITDTIAKYRNLNIALLRQLRQINPEADELVAAINSAMAELKA